MRAFASHVFKRPHIPQRRLERYSPIAVRKTSISVSIVSTKPIHRRFEHTTSYDTELIPTGIFSLKSKHLALAGCFEFM